MSATRTPVSVSPRDRRGPKGTRRFVPQDPTVAPAHHLDPVLTRKHAMSHPGAVILATIGAVFTAYIFNFGGTQNFLDRLVGEVYEKTQTHADQVGVAYNAALPVILIGIVAFIVWIAISSRRQTERSKERSRPLSWREAVTLHGFVSSATKHDVGPDVAREAFRLLLPFCRYGLRTRMSDTLRGDLRMTPAEIIDLFADLVQKTERKRDPRLPDPRLETVLDLMQTVSQCPKRYIAEFETATAERRGEENWVVRPVQ
jgi:hypothetical protein